jgi:TadE-like protein
MATRRRGGQVGQALVETALVLPIFLLVLYSIIEFGRYIYTVQVLNDAAREGTRYAIVHGSQALCPSGPMPGGATNPCDPFGDRVTAVVQKYAVGFVASVSFPVIATCPAPAIPANPCWQPNNQRQNTVTIQVRTVFNTLLPVPLPPITVDGSSTLVINH